MERRFSQLRAEIRSAEATSKGNRIEGVVASFDNPTTIRDVSGKSFREIVRPQAFTRSLVDRPDVMMFFNHDSSRILGRVSNSTLSLRVTPTGLEFSCLLPDTQDGRDAAALVARRDVTGCSFGFLTREDRWSKGEELLTRELLDVELFECSIVSAPAYETGTSVDLRSVNLDAKSFDARARLKLKLRLLNLDR